jgi:tryptophan synthase alpha chain
LSELIKEKFKNKKPFIAYIMGGYPSLEKSYITAKTLIENGVDMLELGVPFSDPVADGPTIQVAHEKAVKDGITPLDVLNLAERLKSDFPNTPLILMTYYNPIFVYGEEKFLKLAKEKGIDGLIIPDLPPEEAKGIKEIIDNLGMSLIFLIAPTTYSERIKMIGNLTTSFIYYVSLTGITGARDELPWIELEKKVKEIKEITKKPVAVGFGVSKKEHTERLSKIADGVIVGSAIVKLQGKGDFEGIKSLVKELREGLI